MLTAVDMDLVDVDGISCFAIFVSFVDNIRDLLEPLCIKVFLYYSTVF